MDRDTYFSEKRIAEIERKIELLIKEKDRNSLGPEFIFLDNADLLQLLQISANTAEKWRKQQILVYTRIHNKIYYTLAEIANMMARYRHPR